MNSVSLTGVGLLVTLVEMALKHFGLLFPEGTVLAAINGLITFVGFVAIVFGQMRRKDLHFGLVRK